MLELLNYYRKKYFECGCGWVAGTGFETGVGSRSRFEIEAVGVEPTGYRGVSCNGNEGQCQASKLGNANCVVVDEGGGER